MASIAFRMRNQQYFIVYGLKRLWSEMLQGATALNRSRERRMIRWSRRVARHGRRRVKATNHPNGLEFVLDIPPNTDPFVAEIHFSYSKYSYSHTLT